MRRLLPLLLLASPVFAYDSLRTVATVQDPGFKNPVAAALGESRLYVADYKQGALYIFDRAGKEKLGQVGAAGGLSNPAAVAVGRGDAVYVADAGGSRILLFDKDGKRLGGFGSPGKDLGRLKSPQGVAVGTDGRVYVADTGNARVQIFAPDGIFLFSLGTEAPGKLSDPTRVAVDNSDNVYVLDGGKVRKFDAQGAFAGDLQVSGTALGVDRFGWFYAVDERTSKVREFDPDGKAAGSFGSEGSGPGQMKRPRSLSIGPDGEIVIADAGNLRVSVFAVENKAKASESPVNLASRLTISGPVRSTALDSDLFTLGEDGALFAHLVKEDALALIDKDGAVVRKFAARGKDKGQVKDPKGLTWSAKDGLFVADYGNQRLLRFDGRGEFKAVFGEKGGFFESRKKEGNLSSPEGIALTEAGTLYVADTGNRRIQAFNAEGVFLFSFGPKLGKVELQEPTKLQWDPAGFLYVLDRGAKRMFKVDPKGELLDWFGAVGRGTRQWQAPVAFAYDGHNYLFVLDQELGRVQVFDRDGKWLMNVFSKGLGEKELQSPAHLAVSGNTLAISDPGKGKLLTYEFHPVVSPPEGLDASAAEGKVELSWKAPDNDWVKEYQVLRSSQAAGPYEPVATVRAPKHAEEVPSAYSTYYYRLASVAATGDVGPASKSFGVFVPGSFNVAPIEMAKIDIPDVFSANYKWYLTHPSGKMELVNNTDQTFKNVKLSFGLKDFMDYPYDTVIPELKARESREVALQATLNNRILDVSEDTPIQAEFTLTYYEKQKPQTISLTKALKVLSRNAIVWDKTERLANFVTTKDPPLIEFGRAVMLSRPKEDGAASPRLKSAALLWEALSSLGVRHLPNAINPYAKVSGNKQVADTVQLPRETLRRKSGECDDTVTLLSALLEGAAIRVAVLDYPGHLNLMFDTGESDAKSVGLPEDGLIAYDNSLWVPVETTLLGKDFLDAYRKGLQLYRDGEKRGTVKIVALDKAREEFEPATLPNTDWRSPLPETADLQAKYLSDAKALAKLKYDSVAKTLEEELAKNPGSPDLLTQLGALDAEFDKPEDAAKRFEAALAADPHHPGALNNVGNLAYLKGEYAEAEKRYLAASEADPGDGGIWMNLARAAFKQGHKDDFKKYAAQAVTLDPELKPAVDGLGQSEK